MIYNKKVDNQKNDYGLEHQLFHTKQWNKCRHSWLWVDRKQTVSVILSGASDRITIYSKNISCDTCLLSLLSFNSIMLLTAVYSIFLLQLLSTLFGTCEVLPFITN